MTTSCIIVALPAASPDESMSLLASHPNATEILVERVKPLRFSEVNGADEQTIAMVNSH